MTFPQLYTKTAYSLLKSTLTISEYVAAAKDRGYDTIAICDEDVLYGAVEFFNACQKNDLKGIIGCELTVTFQETDFSLVAYAKNVAGYQNLMQLSSQKMITGSLPLTAAADFADLVVIFPCAQVTELENFQRLQTVLPELVVGILQESQAVEVAAAASDQRCVLLHEVRYLEPTDAFAIQTLAHIQAGTQIPKEELAESTGQQAFLPQAELLNWAETAGLTSLIEQTEQTAASCHLEIPLQQTLLPHYPVAEKVSAGEYLAQLCWEKLPQRVTEVTEVYRKRLTMELNVIHQMGFDDYFLIVWDVMDYIHRSQIVTGAGRGSAAGSLVAYVLAITEVDPIQYDLLFERFLNPERHSMPDIDLDIPDNKRNQVLAYVNQKYGQSHVAQIATFGTMAAKMVLRDVSRVFGLSQSEATRWSKAVPNQLKITLQAAYEQSKKLRELAQANEKSRLLFETALKLEGLPRHVSTHAAGVVISDQPLVELVPLQKGSDELWLTQFTMTDIEAIGLLKMDFLGLKNLAIIDYALKNIQQTEQLTLDLKKIPLDDPKTLALFQQGETSGVFQFESAGIRNVLRKLGPTSIEDIAAVNALYRPGPMQNIEHFIARKKGREPITYPEESLIPILKNTYGIIVYQEQIMQVASKMAGFSLGQADILRRAVSKKKKTLLDEERRHFVNGALAQGYTEASAQKVYDYIERFANYGFNRSHAFAYSFVGYQLAYLKAHYPGAFFTALLETSKNDQKKIREYAAEAKKRGVKLLAPDINQSRFGFTLTTPTEIRFGLSAIKGVRRDFVANIQAVKKTGGAFTSLDQFLLRIDSRWLKEEIIKPLIVVGAFDGLEKNRRKLMTELPGKIQNVEYSGGSLSLLDVMSLKDETIADFPLAEKLAYEAEYLGFYLSGHPTENYPKLTLFEEVQTVSQLVAGQVANVLLYAKDLRVIRTKKGEQMAFLTGDDPTGELSVTLFPRLYRTLTVEPGTVYLAQGKVELSRYDQILQLLAERLVAADTIEANLPNEKLFLRLSAQQDTTEFHQQLTELLQRSPGQVPVVIYFEKNQRKIVLNKRFWIELNDEILATLRDLLGESNVVIA